MAGRKAGWAWAVLVAFIVAVDYEACKNNNETMTRAMIRWMRNPVLRPFLVTLHLLIAKHLIANKFLPQLDPLNYIAERWRDEDR